MIQTIFSEQFFYVLGVIAAMVVPITGVINGLFKITSGFWPQFVSWVVATLLSTGCILLNVVTIADPKWLVCVLLSLCVGLVSNGIYDVPAIKELVGKLSNLFKSK